MSSGSHWPVLGCASLRTPSQLSLAKRVAKFIVSKIAVGIFAGGVVFATLLPELKITLGSVVIDKEHTVGGQVEFAHQGGFEP